MKVTLLFLVLSLFSAKMDYAHCMGLQPLADFLLPKIVATLSNSLTGFFEKVYSTIKDTTNGYMEDVISEFAEKVRFVMREEIHTYTWKVLMLCLTISIACLIISIPSQIVSHSRLERQLGAIERTILNISETLSGMSEKQADGELSVLAEEVQRLKTSLHSKTKTICTCVQGLKTTVDGVRSSSGSIATLTDEVRQLKAKMNEMHSINATLIELVQQLKNTATPIQVATGSTVPLDEESSFHSCSTGQSSPRKCSVDDIPVSGERIIWGAQKNTIENEVEETIARLTSLSASDFIITKKYSDTESQRWWFVIAAEESVLLKLQEEWHLVKDQTHWKLKKPPID